MSPDFWQVVFGRRSVRRYTGLPVPENLLEKIIQAALGAPSAHNAQPWHFIVILSREVKNKLALEMAAIYRRDMAEQGFPEHVVEKRIMRSLTLFTEAPVVVVPVLVASRLKKQAAPHLEELEKVMAIQSVAMAAGQLMLAAAASGLGACWFAAPLFCPGVAQKQLGLGAGWEPQGLITIGYPAEEPPPKGLLPPEETVTFIRPEGM